jgi:chromodomain-helicase-DNA-binding protein 7
MDFGTIINRVYLGIYQEYMAFWSDVGLVFRNCRRFNTNPYSDIRRLCDTLRECAIVLYKNWYNLMLEKYNQNAQSGRQAVDDAKKKNALVTAQ